MEHTKLEAFTVIGIPTRTTNKNNQSAADIGALWNKFMSEDILQKIPNKANEDIYSIYTEYEGDYTKPYTTILGCKVKNTDIIPEGMVAINIQSYNYATFTAKGDLQEGLVYKKWLEIWNMDLDRAYEADFEIYGSKAQNPNDAEVDIYIGMK